MRFFSPVKEFSHAQAAQLTQIDYDREMAFILADHGPAELAEIHGVVRLSADPDGERGEFAIVVEDGLTNQGLGTLLMRRMLEYAASRGIDEVYGFVLTENEPMLDLCRDLGFRIQTKLDNPGIVQVARAGLRR